MNFGNYLYVQYRSGFGLQKVLGAVFCFQYVGGFGLNVARDLSTDTESPCFLPLPFETVPRTLRVSGIVLYA